MVSLKERTIKSELWEVKFKKLKKTSDFQTLSKASFQWSSISSNLKFKSATKNQKLTDKRFKNSWLRTINSVMKSEMLRRT